MAELKPIMVPPSILRWKNVLSCDVFSTESDGKTPLGTETFVLLDTVSLEWKGIR